jgi:TP901 family phage tail tape measure protein
VALVSTLFDVSEAKARGLSSEGFADLTAQEAKNAVEANREQLRLLKDITAEERRRLKQLIQTSNIQNTITRLTAGPEAGTPQQLIGDVSSFGQLVKNSNAFDQAMNKTAKTIPELTAQMRFLETIVNKYNSEAFRGVPITQSFADALNKLLRSTGVQVKVGDKLGTVVDAITGKYRGMKEAVASTTTELNKQVTAQDALDKRFRNFDQLMAIAIDKIIRYRVAFFLMRKSIEGLRDSIKTFSEVQAEIAQIEKVIIPVAGQLDALKNAAFEFAAGFGRSVQEVLKIMKIFAQQGKQFNEILNLTETALLAMNAANLDAGEAVEGLTAITKAYNLEATELVGTIDKLTAVQEKHAITAQDLINAMKLIAAASQAVGLTMDQLLGQITAVGAVTRKSGKAVAQSLKTIFARFERNETVQELKAIGIEVQNTDGTVRNLQEVLTELRETWDTLNDAQRFAIAQTVAGIRRYTDFLVLMDNFDEAVKATSDSLNAQGQAQRNNVIELRTFARQLEQVKALFQEAFTDLADSGLADVTAGVIQVGRAFAFLLAKTPGVAAITATVISLGTALIFGKAVSVGLNVVFGKLASTIISILNPTIALKGATEALTVAQTEAEFATAVHRSGVGDLAKALKALFSAEVATVSLGGKQFIVNRAIGTTATEASVATAFQAKATTAAGAAATVATPAVGKLALAFQILKSSLFGVAGAATAFAVIAVGIGLITRKIETSQIKHNATLAENTKLLKSQISAEKGITKEIKLRLNAIGRGVAALQDENIEFERGILIRAKVEKDIQRLITLQGSFGKAVRDGTKEMFDFDEALDLLAQRKAVEDRLSVQFEERRDRVLLASRDLIEGLEEVQKSIATLDATNIEFGKFFTPDIEKDLKAAGVRARAAYAAGFGEPKGALPGDISSPLQLGLVPSEESLERAGFAGGKAFAKQTLFAAADFFKKNRKEIERALKVLGPAAEVLGEDLGKAFENNNVDDWKKSVQEAITAARSFEDILTIIRNIQSPLQTINDQLGTTIKNARDTVNQLFNLAIISKIAEDAGFTYEILLKIIDQTTLKVKDSIGAFRAFSSSIDETAKTGIKIQDTFAKAGLAFNPTIEAGKRAEKVIRDIVAAQERLLQISQQPDLFIPRAARELQQIVNLTGDVKVIKDAFSSAILAFTDTDDIDSAITKLKESNELAAKFAKQLAEAQGIEKASEAALGLSNALLEAGENGKLLPESLEFLRRVARNLEGSLDGELASLKLSVEEARKFKENLDAAKLALRGQQQLFSSTLQAQKTLGASVEATAVFREKLLKQEVVNLRAIALEEGRILALTQTKVNLDEEGLDLGDENVKLAGDLRDAVLRQAEVQEEILKQQFKINELTLEHSNTVKEITKGYKAQKDIVREVESLTDEITSKVEKFADLQNTIVIGGLEEQIKLEKARIEDQVKATRIAINAAQKQRNETEGASDALKDASKDTEIMSGEMANAAVEAVILSGNVDKLERNLIRAKLEASELFKNLVRDAKIFEDLVDGISDSISQGFASLPDIVSQRFERIGDLEDEIVRKQAEIINIQNQADQGAADYARAAQEIERAKDGLKDLNEELETARSLSNTIKELFLEIGQGIGDTIIDVQADLLKEQLKEAFTAGFGGGLKKRIDEFREIAGEAFIVGSDSVHQAIISGADYHARVIREAIVGAAGGTVAPGFTPSTSASFIKGLQEKEEVGVISEEEKVILDSLKKAEIDGTRAIVTAIGLMAIQVGASIGQAIGGGGIGAGIGSQIGSLASFFGGGPLSPTGAVLGTLGGLLGGALGGIFDTPRDEVDLSKLVDTVLPKNTEAIEKNTQAFNDLRSELINAPANFTLPATSSGFNPGFGSLSGASGGGVNVSINIQGNADSSTVRQIEEVMDKTYANQTRRFGRRASR